MSQRTVGTQFEGAFIGMDRLHKITFLLQIIAKGKLHGGLQLL